MFSAFLIVVTQQFSLLEVQFLDDSRAILGNSFSRPTINIYYNYCNLENKQNTRIHLPVAFQLCEVPFSNNSKTTSHVLKDAPQRLVQCRV